MVVATGGKRERDVNEWKMFALLTTKNGRMSFVSFLIIGYIENLRMLLKRNAGVPLEALG